MLGYIDANIEELNIEQKEQYRAFCCGVCRDVRRYSGNKGRTVVDSSMVFLAILLDGMYKEKGTMEHFLCPLHPMSKKCSYQSEATQYASAMNCLLVYYQLKKEWQWERSLSKKSMMQSFKKSAHVLSQQYPRQARAIEQFWKKLAVAEAGKEDNLEAVSGLSGAMYAEIFDYKQDGNSEELRNMGFYLGKYSYLLHAYENAAKDEQRGVYNPCILFRELNKKEDYDTFVLLQLRSMMAECTKSYERLSAHSHRELLHAILYSGVWEKFEEIREKTCRKQRGKKNKA